jgi:hypothetical protein
MLAKPAQDLLLTTSIEDIQVSLTQSRDCGPCQSTIDHRLRSSSLTAFAFTPGLSLFAPLHSLNFVHTTLAITFASMEASQEVSQETSAQTDMPPRVSVQCPVSMKGMVDQSVKL